MLLALRMPFVLRGDFGGEGRQLGRQVLLVLAQRLHHVQQPLFVLGRLCVHACVRACVGAWMRWWWVGGYVCVSMRCGGALHCTRLL